MAKRAPIVNVYDELTHLLREQHRQVAARLRDLRRESRGAWADAHDADDERQQRLVEEIDFALAERASDTAALIHQALARFDHGLYGTCAECGRDIGARRLRVLPFTDCCVSCQEKREEAERHGLPRLRWTVAPGRADA
jgi:DnaK suppressor protein